MSSFFIRPTAHHSIWWYLKRRVCGRSFLSFFSWYRFLGVVPIKPRLQAVGLAPVLFLPWKASHGHHCTIPDQWSVCFKHHLCLLCVCVGEVFLQICSFFYSSVVLGILLHCLINVTCWSRRGFYQSVNSLYHLECKYQHTFYWRVKIHTFFLQNIEIKFNGVNMLIVQLNIY